MIDFEEAKAHPEEVFESPEAICDNRELTTEQKIEILESWRQEIQQMIVAEEENMPVDDKHYQEEEDLLDKIHAILVKLKNGN